MPARGYLAETQRSARPSAAPVKVTIAQDEPTIEVPETLLIRWNSAMAIFHLFLTILTFTLGNLDLGVDVYRPSYTFDVQTIDGERVWSLIPSWTDAGTLPLTILTGMFFILSFAFHLMNATVLRKFYISELKNCRTPTRWIEYTFSASIVIVVIAYGLGMRDRSLLIATGVLVASTMPYGYWTEERARPLSSTQWKLSLSSRLLPWLLGNIPQAAAWIVILLQFYDGQTEEAANAIPWFVYVILWAEFVLFWSFGFAQLATQFFPPRAFWKGEIGFQVLSLVSKGTLGLLLIANVLMLSRFDDIYE